jgi:transcriptional regulator
MVVTRFDARAKLSQNKSEGVKDRIENHFVGSNPQLAREMKRVRENKPVDKG